MLKKYSELTEEEKKKVFIMFSDQTTVEMYLYNFDKDGGFHGRQYTPPSGKDEKVGIYGTIVAESTVPEVEEDTVEVLDIEEDGKVKKVTRKKAKR